MTKRNTLRQIKAEGMDEGFIANSIFVKNELEFNIGESLLFYIGEFPSGEIMGYNLENESIASVWELSHAEKCIYAEKLFAA